MNKGFQNIFLSVVGCLIFSTFHEQYFYVSSGSGPACWHWLFILLAFSLVKGPKSELFARFYSFALTRSDSSSEIIICRNTDSWLETSTGNCLEQACSNTVQCVPRSFGIWSKCRFRFSSSGLRFCLSHKLPDVASIAGLQTTLWDLEHSSVLSSFSFGQQKPLVDVPVCSWVRLVAVTVALQSSFPSETILKLKPWLTIF